MKMNFSLILFTMATCCVSNVYAEYSVERSQPVIDPAVQARQSLLQQRAHLELINYLILENGYQSYLEIGIAGGQNLNAVIAKHKIGVDPNPFTPATYHLTSDDFFQMNRETFDIIFIDGLHLHEQVIKDIENSLACLNPNGIIVVHDCTPATEQAQSRTPFYGGWNGDVWKAAAYLRMHVENIGFCVLDTDHGCGIVVPQSTQSLYPAIPLEKLDWDFYVKNRNELLNVISLEEWLSTTRN